MHNFNNVLVNFNISLYVFYFSFWFQEKHFEL